MKQQLSIRIEEGLVAHAKSHGNVSTYLATLIKNDIIKDQERSLIEKVTRAVVQEVSDDLWDRLKSEFSEKNLTSLEKPCCAQPKPCAHWSFDGESWVNGLSGRRKEA